ncbi:MAG TPA: alpha/beta hydrolase, partial [Kofleriaceae bacterium]
DGAGNEAAAAAARDQWRDGSDAQFARQIDEMFRPMSTRPERMAPVLAEIAKSDRRAIGDAVYELSVMTVRDLGRIRAPVLVVLADGALQDDFRRQARAIREHSVVVLPRTGHFVMLDDPRGFFAAVDDFLEAHSAIANRRTPPRNARRN